MVWVRSSEKKKSSALRILVHRRVVCHREEGIYVGFGADTRPLPSSRKAPRPDRVGFLYIFAKQKITGFQCPTLFTDSNLCRGAGIDNENDQVS